MHAHQLPLLAASLVLNCLLLSAHAASQPPLVARVVNDTALAFKILQLADLHFTGVHTTQCQDPPKSLSSGDSACTEAVMSAFIEELLDAEKPDFVAFTGDNVQTANMTDHQSAVDAFTKGVEERKIPYAVVFGNHDDENDFPREDIMKMVTQKSYSYAQRGPTDIAGVGNYQLSVKAPGTNDSVLHMYFLDSGGYPDLTKYPDVKSKYDWIKDSQVAYYRNVSLTNQGSQTTPLPALMFFHIPLQEHNYTALDVANVVGAKNEVVSSSQVESKMFSALVDRNEVKAVFVGHDHVNEYCYKKQGIQLCYSGGAGLGVAYGASGFARRARVIEWSVDSSNKRTVKSWKRLFGSVTQTCCHETLVNESDTAGGSAAQLTANKSQETPNSSLVHSGAAATDLRMMLLLSAAAIVHFAQN